MEIFYSVALLVVAVIISNMVYTIFPKLPLTFFQILCGLVLSALPIFRNYALYPEIFMVGIIAPLMFNDGRNTNSRDLQNMMQIILSMAVYLAVITALTIGFFSHLLMATIPLSLSFALAAIVTPTDSLALKSITENVHLPKNIASTLEGESLFNDASGLVIFNLALTAFITGKFSLGHGLTNFVISFFGGLLFGLIAGMLFIQLQTFLVNKSMDTSTVIVPFSLMTPIAIYLTAEHFEFSGILAVVAAGIIYGVNQSRLKLTSTNVRLVTGATWGIVSSLLNGVVFVLLGVTLPSVISNIIPLSTILILELSALALSIYLAMGVVRFLWAKFNFIKLHQKKSSTFREAFLVAIGGVHGTITLSMALSLPLTLAGHSFPLRNQIIFVATVVILLSLIIPAIVLPQLLPGQEHSDQEKLLQYRAKMVDYSIARIKSQPSISLTDRNYVIDMLGSQKQGQVADKEQLKKIMDQTHKIEIQVVSDLLSKGQIPKSIANQISRRLVAAPQGNRGFGSRFKLFFKIQFSGRRKRRVQQAQRISSHLSPETNQKIRNNKMQIRKTMEDAIYTQVNAYLDKIETSENSAAVAFARNGYNFRHARIDRSDGSDDRRNQLLIEAFQYEYSYVAEAFKNNEISRGLSDQLNQSITTDQMVYMASE